MWTNKLDLTFILIQFKGKGKVKFTFPISLAIFLDLLVSIKDIVTITKAVIPMKKNETSIWLNISSAENIIEEMIQTFHQLNKSKEMTLVKVELSEIYIEVSIV